MSIGDKGPRGDQGARGLDGIQGPRGPMGQMSTSNENGTNGDFVVEGSIIGDGSQITGITTAHVVGLDATISSLATTVSVDTKIAGLVGGADGALDTLKEIGDALKSDESAAAALVTVVSTKAVKTDVDAQVAQLAASVAAKAPLANPVFTGTISIDSSDNLVNFIYKNNTVSLTSNIMADVMATTYDGRIALAKSMNFGLMSEYLLDKIFLTKGDCSSLFTSTGVI